MRPSPLRRLLPIFALSRPLLVGAGLSLVVAAAARLVLTVVVGRWADGPLARHEPLLGDAITALVATAALAAATFSSRALVGVVDRRLQRRLRDDLGGALLRARRRAFGDRSRGELASAVLADVPAVAGLADIGLRRILGDGLVVVGALALMVTIAPRLAVGLLLVTPIAVVVIARASRLVRQRERTARAAAGGIGGLLSEQLASATTLRLLGATESQVQRLADASARLHRASVHSELAAAGLLGLVWAGTGFAVLAIVGFGTVLARSGGTSPGGLVAFAFAAIQVVEPIRRSAEVAAAIQRALAAAERVFATLDQAQPETSGDLCPGRATGGLVLAGVDFGWQPDRTLVDQLDLTIRPGEHVALVGASGAGKSTLLGLLVRLQDPSAGTITLDGHDLRDLDLAWLRRQVLLVEQDPGVLSGTLREALILGCETAPSETDILQAASTCGLTKLILEVGLDGRVGEDGASLSGGERQRLALARAVLRNPAVLLLDEATSALDGSIEAAILGALESWLARRTVLVVSHRLTTVRRWPRLVVLADGRILADGPYSALTPASRALLFGDQTKASADEPVS